MLRFSLTALFAAAIVALIPASALAADIQTGESITVGPNQVVTDDLYAFGTNVVVAGTVQGDVIAAGSTVTISGHVTGSVMAAGSTVTVSGPVGGSVRIAGSVLNLTAPVGTDALMAGSILALDAPGLVSRDALLAGATISVQAPVARNVMAAGNKLTIASPVGGSVTAEVNDLELADGAVVSGPVSYISNQNATVAPGAITSGTVQRTAPVVTTNPWEVGGVDLLALLRGFVGMAALGLLLVFALPRATATAAATLRSRWVASLAVGFAILVATPVVGLLIFVLGLLIGGWWIAFMLLFASAVLGIAGYLLVAVSVGTPAARALNPRLHIAWAMLIGLFVLAVVSVIPVLGGLVVLAATDFGVGAITLSALEARHEEHEVPRTPLVEPTAPIPLQPVAA